VRSFALALAIPAVGGTAWQALAAGGVLPPAIMPSPADIAATLWALVRSGEMWTHVLASGLRVVEGFALAAALGLSLGVAIGLSPTVERMAALPIQLIKPVPPIAWIPLAILWFGIGEGAKVYIIFIGALFPILINTIDGIRQTDGRYVELARILEVPRRRFIRQVILPGALPQIMTGLRIGLTVSWMCVVAAELIAASRGLGFLIMDARQLSQSDVVLAGMIAMGVLGKATDDLLRLAERRLITWRTAFTGE
jgi:sulfonate transport system permease protein